MPSCHHRLQAIALALACLLVAAGVHAAGDPSVQWRTLETDHFRIHYAEQNRTLAFRLAELAEQTHVELTRFLGDPVQDVVDVVVIDHVDTANGSARSIPYNLVTVYAMAPEWDSSLGDSDDWLRQLFLHEYVHILHINEVSGISALINAVLGKTVVPNQTLPRWYIEGLATYSESAFTEGGRLRNNAFRMYLRMDALSDRFRNPENLGGYPVAWPSATGWYLYGSDFVDWVARTYGPDRWVEFNRVIGGALSPLAVNSTAVEIFGHDILELWGIYAAAARGEFVAEATAVAAAGETRVIPVTRGGNQNGYPRCRGPREIGFIRDDGHSAREIVRQDLITGETETMLAVFGNGSFDWSPDGRMMAYTEVPRFEQFYVYNDLFLLDAETGAIRRLTEGARAREPAFSPDGRRLAFVSANSRGGVDLKELDLDSGAISTLLAANNMELASTPDYSPDGETIAFSLWTLDWGRDLYLLSRDDGELTRLTHDRAGDLSPSFAPDGHTMLFSSDRTGIYNIYSIDLEDRSEIQLTNVISGAFSPQQCAASGPLFVRTYGIEGFDVGRIDELRALPAPASYDRPEVDYPELPQGRVDIADRGYNPFVSLYPRSWSPIVSQRGDSVDLGASVAASDPLFRHIYTGSVTYDLGGDHLNWGFRYSYTRLPVDLNLHLAHSQYTNTAGLVAETRYVPFEEESLSAGLSLSLPLSDERSGHSIYAGYSFRDVQPEEWPDIHHDPGDIEPRYPEFGRYDDLSIGWSWGNARGFAYSVSAERGTQVNLHLGMSSPVLGADFDRVELGWGLRQYFAVPYLPGHVLAILLTGAVGRSSADRRALYGVGGFPRQDLLLSIIENTPIGAGFLRGYPENVQIGSQYHLLSAEYRLPLIDIDTGIYTLPIFFERLYLAAFVDCGTAVDDLEGFETLRTGVGGELRLKSWLSYVVPADLRAGFARGLTHEGINQFYVLYGGTF